MFRSIFLGISVCLLLIAGPAVAGDEIGSVRTVSGKGYVVRGGELKPVEIGGHVFMDDTLVTVANSSMGVTFKDDTQVALGEKTELLVDEYVFDPKAMNAGFLAKMRVGSAVFLSGKIAELAPDRVKVETPLTTIGIRGTRFLVRVEEQPDE